MIPVRITAAAPFAPTLVRALSSVLEHHPGLQMEPALDGHFADLGGGQWDLAVRIAPRIADASLLARRLAPPLLITLAARAYFAQHGASETPDGLARHWLIGLRLPAMAR